MKNRFRVWNQYVLWCVCFTFGCQISQAMISPGLASWKIIGIRSKFFFVCTIYKVLESCGKLRNTVDCWHKCPGLVWPTFATVDSTQHTSPPSLANAEKNKLTRIFQIYLTKPQWNLDIFLPQVWPGVLQQSWLETKVRQPKPTQTSHSFTCGDKYQLCTYCVFCACALKRVRHWRASLTWPDLTWPDLTWPDLVLSTSYCAASPFSLAAHGAE